MASDDYNRQPKLGRLTAACGAEAGRGCATENIKTTIVSLNDLNIGKCRACDRGWGTCREKHYCQAEDDFQELHASMKEMDAFIMITPVYWWDLSESFKAFFDRLRRCEGFKKENHFLRDKQFICIAAAGGTGNGLVSCLGQMEKFVDHVRGVKVDFIGVTRKNRAYKLNTIREAAAHLAARLQEQQD